jgi:hypothetical protein
MSANNQILIKKYRNKWYVFNNVQAESWYDEKGNFNHIQLDSACGEFKGKQAAYDYAQELEEAGDDFTGFNTEYGMAEYLIKDGGEVTIIEKVMTGVAYTAMPLSDCCKEPVVAVPYDADNWCFKCSKCDKVCGLYTPPNIFKRWWRIIY